MRGRLLSHILIDTNLVCGVLSRKKEIRMAYISKISKNDLGEYIKELRTQKGVTLIQLAAKAGCSTSSINMAENHLRNLRSDTAANVLKALGLKKTEIKQLFEKYGY